MDLLATLIWGASIRKALALEAWLAGHSDCYPGAIVKICNKPDNAFTNAECSCGERLELTVTTAIDVKVIPKAIRW